MIFPGTNVGCALGGGGARGLAHVGVLKALERHGIYPRFVTGTSMGALVGALYASGLSATQIESMALSMSWSRWAYLADVTLIRPGGFIRGNRILSLLKSILGDIDFSMLKLRFACVATDIRSGEPVVLSDGPVAAAVRASIAIPGIITPAKANGRYLVDGGLVNEVPVGLCRALGAAYVIGVNVNPEPARMTSKSSSRPPGITEILTQSVVIAGYHLAKENMREADLAISPSVESVGFWQFQRAADCIRTGEEAACQALEGAPGATPEGVVVE